MNIYDYSNYKAFLADLIKSYPKKGHGQARRLALHLGVNAVVVSQILSGERDFTPEQALGVSKFFGLDELATEYLVLLIQRARAGTHELKNFFERKLERQRAAVLNIKNRVSEHRELTESEKGIFYSNWFYAGVSLLSSIEGYNSVDAMAAYFKLSRAKVAEVVAWLVQHGLCEERDGRIVMGVTATHVSSASPFVNSHRRSWRLKGLEKFSEPGPSDVFYSGPYSLSAKDIEHIRKELLQLIASVSKRVGDSPAEKLACLNIDFFEF